MIIETINDSYAKALAVIAELEAALRLTEDCSKIAATRIAELEAANGICHRDIDGLMSSADKLEARIAELEEACREFTEHSVVMNKRNAEIEYELREAKADLQEADISSFARVEEAARKDEREKSAARIAELEAEPWAKEDRLAYAEEELGKATARIAELEAATLAERAACAKIADEYILNHVIAAAIRTRPAPMNNINVDPLLTPDYLRKLQARIAELEAQLVAWAGSAVHAPARIAELEAALEALQGRLQAFDAFMDAAVLAEREACAQIAEKHYHKRGWHAAAAIRSRPAP